MVKFGLMNNPSKPLVDEIEWIGNNGFDFVDLTIEPSKAYFDDIEQMGGFGEIKKLLYRYGMDAIGHTTFYLPFSSPIKALRDAAVLEAAKAGVFFSRLKIKYMTVHISRPSAGMFTSGNETFEWVAESMKKLAEMVKINNITLMAENSETLYWSDKRIEELLFKVPELKFHLDIGHYFVNHCGNLGKLDALLEKLGDKLVHVHAHDNDSTKDQHLPIGAGKIDWEKFVRSLKNIGYNDTITLELHSPEKEYVLVSRDKLKKLWRQI